MVIQLDLLSWVPSSPPETATNAPQQITSELCAWCDTQGHATCAKCKRAEQEEREGRPTPSEIRKILPIG